jgi:hypothetical protein
MKKVIIGLMLSGTVHAQEKITTQLEIPQTTFKMKSELRSSTNSFSDKSSAANFRVRLDPAWTKGNITFGLRQDIKNKVSGGVDAYTLENTRAFVGQNYKADDWQIQPRIEAWLPTNVMERNSLTYQGSPGVALKVKRKWLNVTSNYELNGRKNVYQNSKNTYADTVMFNELKNEIRISKNIAGNLNIKFDDSWDQAGNRSQKYLFEQSLGVNLANNLDLEIGHAIEKPTLAKNKDNSFVVYDKDLSQMYTAVSYVY